jgi:hypothetical protein
MPDVVTVEEYSLLDEATGNCLRVSSFKHSFDKTGTTWKTRAAAMRTLMNYTARRARVDNPHLPQTLKLKKRVFTVEDCGYEEGFDHSYIQAVVRTLDQCDTRPMKQTKEQFPTELERILEAIITFVRKDKYYHYCIEAKLRAEIPTIKVRGMHVYDAGLARVYFITREEDFIIMRMALAGEIIRYYDFKAERAVIL